MKIELKSEADRQEWRDGWSVVAAGSVGMGTGIGLYTMVQGLFIIPLQSEFGWSRGELAAAGLLALLSSFIFPVLGTVVDRWGSRVIAALGMLLLAGGFVILSNLNGILVFYYVSVLFVVVVGTMTTAIVFTRAVNTWFERQKGLAIGITMTGVSISTVVVMPILERIISQYGWRTGFLALAVIPTVIGFPIVLKYLRDRISPKFSTEKHPAAENAAKQSQAGLKSALGDLRFWLLAFAMLTANLPVGGILSQLQPLLRDTGFSGSIAALLGSLFAISIAVGRMGTGFLLDRFWAPGVAAATFVVPLIGATIFLSADSPALLIAALAVFSFGIAQGAEGDFMAYLTPKFFGLKSYGVIFGSLLTFVSIALGLGAVLFGVIHDKTGSYKMALIIAILAYLAGAFFILVAGLINRHKHSDM